MENSKIRRNFTNLTDREMELSEHISKLVAAIAAAIVAAVGTPVPPLLAKMTWIVVLLVIADTFAGVYVAIWRKQLESKRLVEKLAHKGITYCVLMLIGFVPCALFSNWTCCYAMAMLMVSRELLSLIENAKKLMQEGKDFGRIAAFIDKIGSVLAVSAEQAVAVVKIDTPKEAAMVVVTPTPAAVEGETK